MIIKCIRCKKEFEQVKGERTCGCRPSQNTHYPHRKDYNNNYHKLHPEYHYLGVLQRNFQDPIYQFRRLQHQRIPIKSIFT